MRTIGPGTIEAEDPQDRLLTELESLGYNLKDLIRLISSTKAPVVNVATPIPGTPIIPPAEVHVHQQKPKAAVITNLKTNVSYRIEFEY